MSETDFENTQDLGENTTDTLPKNRGGRHRREFNTTIPERTDPHDGGQSARYMILAGIGTLRTGDKKLGEGGGGLVHPGISESGKTVAVKISDTTAPSRDNLEHEQKMHGRLVHPNILKLRDGGLVTKYRRGKRRDARVLVTELASEGSLDKVLQTKDRFSIGETSAIGVQLASALEAIHAKGLVHRDIKPANIFVTGVEGDTMTVAIGDFGISEPPVEIPLEKGGAKLTVSYAAPEQFDERHNYQSDIYSLGVVLYETTTGEKLFGPDKIGYPGVDYVTARMLLVDTKNEMKYNMFIDSRLKELGNVSPELAQLLKDMLPIDQTKRPNAAVVKNRLEEIRKKYSGQADRIATPVTTPLRPVGYDTTVGLDDKTETATAKIKK